jgi:hypothetical protein
VAAALARLRRFARAVAEDSAEVDVALPATRALFASAGVPFRFAGGVAVLHHGYARTTEDIDVLVDGPSLARLSDEHLAAHGFSRLSRARLRHVGSGVRVDLLISEDPIPRRDGVTYPAPATIESSPRDPDFLGLAPLLELKLWGGRSQDTADIVALLTRTDEAHYLPLEAAMPAKLRPELALLRRDALEELASDG